MITATLALCGAYIYFSIYTGFSAYDDEGGILIVLRDLLSGHVLYDQVPAMYGPAGLLGKWLILKVLHLPATHDVGRAITGSIWFLTSLCCGFAVWRWTRQVAAFVLATSTVCLVLRSVVREPGHPQDLCGLLLAGVVMLCTATNGRWRGVALLGIGVAGGLLAMVKINLGVFFAVAWIGALLPNRPSARAAFGLMALLLPVVLMRQHLGEPTVRNFLIEVECSLIACGVILVAGEPLPALPRRQFWMAILAMPLTSLAVCVLACCGGSSVHGLLEGVIRQPLRVSNLFFRWPPNHARAVVVSLVGLLLAISSTLLRECVWMRSAAAAVRVLIGVVAFNLVFQGDDRAMIQILPAFCWTLLLPGGGALPGPFARTFLTLLAVCQTLWIYPVAGSQVAFALLLPTALLSFGLVEGVVTLLDMRSPATRFRGGATFTAALVVFCLAADAIQARAAFDRYRSRVSLDLPGAHLVRVDRSQRDRLHLIVDNLRANGDLLLNLPALNSLHLWAGLPPPTMCNPTSWLYLTAAQSAQAYRALSADRRSCVLWDDTQAKFWTNDSATALDAPLVRLLREKYKPAVTHGTWTLLVPQSRQMAVCISAQGVRREVLLDQPTGYALDLDNPARSVRAPQVWSASR